MTKKSELAAVAGFNVVTLGLLGTLGPVAAPVILATVAIAVYCVFSPLGLVLITALISQIGEFPGLSSDVSYAIKWGITSLFLILLVSRWLHERPVFDYRFSYVEKYFLITILWVVTCSIFAVRPLETLIEAFRISALWMVYALTRLLIRERAHLGIVLLALLIAVITSSVFSFVKFSEGNYSRAAGFLIKPNPYGTFLGFTLPLLAYAIYYFRASLLRYGYHLGMLIGTGALYLTRTRAAWFSVAVQLLAFAILERKKKLLASLAVMTLIGTVVLVSSEVFLFGFSQLLRLSSGNSHRTIRWEKSLEAVARSPVFGYGFNYRNADVMQSVMWSSVLEASSLADKRLPFDPHNVYLHTMLYCGIPGLLIFLMFNWRLLVVRNRLRRESTSSDERFLHAVVFCMIIGALANGFFERNLILGMGATNNYLWIAIGAADAVSDKKLLD